MNVSPDVAVSRIAAAIGEAARARMLYSLADGRARTSTELAILAEVSPSTASVHLNRLRAAGLVTLLAQGKHRYYSLASADVANALERLSVLAGLSSEAFVPNTPTRLRAARTCYDHIAGRMGVLLHDRLRVLGCISAVRDGNRSEYDLTGSGTRMLRALGIDVADIRSARRKFAFPCLDWSERRPHLGGALAAALFELALRSKWVTQDLDSRALHVTARGHREIAACFGIELDVSQHGSAADD